MAAPVCIFAPLLPRRSGRVLCRLTMNTTDSRTVSPLLIIWCLLAAIGGVCSLVLPPYLTAGGLTQPAYGWPLIPWFAIASANLRATVSMVCFFVLGFTLGIAHPRRWLLLAGVAMALPAILNTVNILHDWTRDATSHNLFPFEFLMYAFICLPALAGAFLGFLVRRLLRSRQAA
jgi:hypothetical protein